LHNYQRNIQEEITNIGSMKRLEDIDKKWHDAEQIIEEIEQKAGIPLLNNKNSQVQSEAKRVVREVYDLIKHNFELEVFQEALRIVSELQRHVQERATQLAAFNASVENLQSAYEKQERDLRQLNFDEMSGEAIFDSEDIDCCYQNMLPEDDVRHQLVFVSSAITEPTGRGQSLASFIDRDRTTPYQLQKEVDLKVDSIFTNRGINIVNVIKRFMQNYSLAARSTRFAQIMQEAEPLLRLNLTDPYFHDDLAKSSKLIGFKDTDELEVKQFKNLLEQDLGVSTSVFKPTQADDEILIVNEYAGFPLRLIGNLERMRNPYIREQNSPTSFLHNDSRATFPDIIPPDARRIEELEDIFYPCLAFGLLEENQENHELEFQYYDESRYSYNTASLNPEWSQALEELANRKDMSETLQKLLDDKIAQIETQPELWDNEYFPKLRQFIKEVDQLPEDNPNFPYKATVLGTYANNDPTVKEGIINRFRRKLEQRFKTAQQQNPSTNTFNQKAISGEIVIVDYPRDSDDNMTKRRLEIKQLKQDLDDGILSQEEFDRKRQEIFNKYPV
jgi:hypothetical protein